MEFVGAMTKDRFEHMVTNICLWFSYCKDQTFLIGCPNKEEYKLLQFKEGEHNYDKAREFLSQYLKTRGTIHDISFNHFNKTYTVVYNNNGASEWWFIIPFDSKIVEI